MQPAAKLLSTLHPPYLTKPRKGLHFAFIAIRFDDRTRDQPQVTLSILVLTPGVEPGTSSLPMKCSTA